MHTYYLVLRGPEDALAGLSPSQMQGVIQRYLKWREENSRSVSSGHKLYEGEGRVLRKKGKALEASDGPFMEAKEVLGGLIAIQAGSYEEAQAIAGTCPHLEFGSIEIRRVEPTA